MNKANKLDLEALESQLESAAPIALANDCAVKPQPKAYAYLRVSGLGQVDGDGYDRQLLAIKKYASAAGIKLAGIYREAFTGTKETYERPSWGAMLEDMKHGVTTVLIERLDRLARDLMVQENIIAEMRKHGYTLVSVAEPDLCKDDPTRTLMRQIFGSIAQYERAQIVAKLRGARERMRTRDGRCEGQKPYGAREGEQAVITRIIELRSQGKALDAIAEALNADGVASRSGGLWYGSTVRSILNKAQQRQAVAG